MSAGASTAVLVVEDEPRNTALVRAILGPAGYQLVAVDTLAAARSWLADGRPDLLLLDRHLPDGDGLELARELKSRPGTTTLPILLVSASVLPTDREAALEAGCDGFLMKPIRIDGLLAEVERLLAGA
jgi:CheY-like chemotaxis protein